MNSHDSPVLLIDSSTCFFRAGVLVGRQFVFLRELESSDLAGLFGILRENFEFLKKSGLDLAAYLFCEGPGSLTPLRAGKMMVDCWNQTGKPKPIIPFGSLTITAHHLYQVGIPRARLILPTRRSTWIVANCERGLVINQETGRAGEVDGAAFFLPTFALQSLPIAAQRLEFSLANHGSFFANLLRRTDPIDSPRLRASLQQF